MKAAISCRISEDKVGAGLGVARQREDCEALTAKRGWDLVGLYVDNDVSAYSGKKRPEYRRLLDDMEAGKVDAVVAWHTDRLHRSPRELEEFIDICDKHSVRVETVRAGELDLKTPAGRAVARTLGAWARFESEHKSERIRRKTAERAQGGLPHMGGARCYGYRKDRVTVVPEEAKVLREVTERVLAGEALRHICIELNQRSIRTAQGNLWATPRLRQLLLAPRIAGLIEHHTAGRVRGQWPAIISEEQRARLVALLTDPARRLNPGAPRRWLLSGILRCGECDNPLTGQGAVQGKRYRCAQYRCAPMEHRGCGKIAISVHLIEPHVIEAALSTLERLRIAPDAATEDGHADIDALAADQLQLDELASMYALRAITAKEWVRAKAEIDKRIANRNHVIAERTIDQRLHNLLTATDIGVRDAWPDLPLDQRRSILASLLDRVTVNRAKATRVFDPGRLIPVWRV
jgi:site-specific DNA recombinase